MRTPDDARFQPRDPAPDDYDVGEAYEQAPPPGFVAPQPYSVGSDHPESPSPAPLPPTSPFLTPLPRSARPVRRFLSTWIAAGALALLILVQLVGTVASRLGGEDSEDAGTGTDQKIPEMATAWLLEADDLSEPGADAVFARNPDGAITGPQVIVGDGAWVVAWQSGGPGRHPAGLAALDPADGTILWERPLPGVLCADHAFDGALRCLHEADGTWVYHQIDIATGADAIAVETTLEDVQTVHASAQALVAVGPADPAPHAQMTGLAPDGTELWSVDVAEYDSAGLLFSHVFDSEGEPVLERPRWRDLDGGLMMLWVTPGAAIIDPLTGPVLVHHCRAGTAQGDHYLCQDAEGLYRHALDGSITWSLPGAQLTVPEDRSDARPVAITEPTANQYEIVPVDWETGQVTGPAIHRFAQRPGVWTEIVLPPSGYTLESATIVAGDTSLVALEPRSGDLLWTTALEIDGYVFDIVQVGELAVVDVGSDAIGLDLATGELVWTLRYAGDSLAVVDGVLASIGYQIGVMEVP